MKRLDGSIARGDHMPGSTKKGKRYSGDEVDENFMSKAILKRTRQLLPGARS